MCVGQSRAADQANRRKGGKRSGKLGILPKLDITHPEEVVASTYCRHIIQISTVKFAHCDEKL